LIVGFILAETVLLLAGFALGHPFLGAAAAAGLVYLVLAYRHPNIAWALVWIAFPFSIEIRLPGGNAMYVPTEPMIALALLAWILRARTDTALSLPRSRLNAPLMALAVVALASVVVSHYPLLGFKAWAVAAAYVAFAYTFCFLNCVDPERTERWVPWVVGLGAFWGIYGTVKVLAAGVSLQHAYGAARPFFGEHGTYSAYLAMILPLALLYAVERRGRARLGYAAASLAIGLGIAFSFTRAAWLSLIIVLPVTMGLWAWWRRSLRPVALLAGLLTLITVVVISIGAGGRVARHAESVAETENVSNLERFNRWMAAAEMTKDRPWLGVGYGAYEAAYPQYRRKVIITELAYQHMGAHSEPLRLLAEMGVFGLIASIWFLATVGVLGTRMFLRAADSRARLLALAMLAGFCTYAVHGIFNSYLGIDKITIPFWASLGILSGLERKENAGGSGKLTKCMEVAVH
jgi:O-antigen ligase